MAIFIIVYFTFTQELIGDGILMGDITLLQAYFRLKNRQTEASWDYIVKIGLQCMLEELEARNWSTACQMLKNMVIYSND